jgi:hypothetical protein
MLRPLLFAAASAVILAACASAPDAPDSSSASSSAAAAEASPFNLAFQTADELVAAGNTPTAIQRLMQLVGDTSLTDTQRSETLYKLGTLSSSPTGYDAEGAVDYFNEVLSDYKLTPAAKQSAAALPGAEQLVAEYLAIAESDESGRSEQFLALFNLGRHQDAIDLMVANDITPGNEELLAMYQIGYLCEDPNLTGRAYPVTDRDGTVRNVRFCDFGK